MSGVTNTDVPRCTHLTVLQRGATPGSGICATCGAQVSTNYLGVPHTFVIEKGPIPDRCCKKSERQKWAPPPGAPKRKGHHGR